MLFDVSEHDSAGTNRRFAEISPPRAVSETIQTFCENERLALHCGRTRPVRHRARDRPPGSRDGRASRSGVGGAAPPRGPGSSLLVLPGRPVATSGRPVATPGRPVVAIPGRLASTARERAASVREHPPDPIDARPSGVMLARSGRGVRTDAVHVTATITDLDASTQRQVALACATRRIRRRVPATGGTPRRPRRDSRIVTGIGP